MYRSSLLSLIFLCIMGHVSHAQKLVELTHVSVDTISQEITLQWKYHPDVDTVSIYKCNFRNGCTAMNDYYPPIAKVKMDINALSWKDSDTATSHNYYCATWEGYAFYTPQNNMVLKVTFPENKCKNAALLTWNPYINMNEPLAYYKIWYRKNGNSEYTVDTIAGEHLTVTIPKIDLVKEIRYVISNLDPNVVYEFRVEAVSENSNIHVFSNTDTLMTHPEYMDAVPVHILSVNTIDDRYLKIEVTTERFSKPFEQLELRRSFNSSTFEKIYAWNYTDFNTYSFDDKNVNPKSGLHYYQAIAVNSCKADDHSNILTNIFLRGYRVEQYADSISFKHAGALLLNPPPTYELLRLVNDKKVFIKNLSINNSKCYVDVEPFIQEGAEIKYQIRTENDCYSNTLTIEHEPRLRFPTAFYPESNNMENRTFYPILQFPSSDSYLFIIYNRWGEEVYRSALPPVYGDYHNFQGRWDGTYKGKNCPTGIYAYQITYSFNENSGKYSKSGTVMLVR